MAGNSGGKQAEKWAEHIMKKRGGSRGTATGAGHDAAAEIYSPKKREAEARSVSKKSGSLEKEAVKSRDKAGEAKTRVSVEKVGNAKTLGKLVVAEKKAAAKPQEAGDGMAKGREEKSGGAVAAGKGDGVVRSGKQVLGKDEKKKPKREKQKSRKVMAKKTVEAAGLKRKLSRLRDAPVFRGRFGKRSIRRKSIKKWDRWRVPRGIDVKREIADGYVPRTGFRRPVALRSTHPSGYKEVLVRNMRELESVPLEAAIRIAGDIGKGKKLAMVDRAILSGRKVLNP